MMQLLRKLAADFGGGYVCVVVAFFALVKGFSGGMVRGLALPYFQDELNADLSEYHAVYTFVLIMPWCLKPLFGVVSDLFPLCGYRKRYYVGGACFVMSGACAVLAKADLGLHDAMFAVATATTGVVFADLLMEASYSEMLREKENVSGNSIVLFAWGVCIAGFAASAVAAGFLADAGNAVEGFGVAAVCPALFVLVVGHLPERQSCLATAKMSRYSGYAAVAVLMSVSALACASTMVTQPAAAVAALTVGLCCLVFYASRAVLPDTMFKCNLFMFFADAMHVNFVGATDYFYTSECAGAPNFDYRFYTTYSMLLASLFAFGGIVAFAYLQHLSIKTLFSGLTLLRVVAASAEVAQAARLNESAGIDDHTFYLLGEAVVQPVVSMMFAVPMIVLTARLVTPGSEAMCYALLAGTQNLGLLAGSVAGQVVTEAYNLDGCNFRGLPGALVLGHMAMPLLCVPLAHLMLPNLSLAVHHS